MNYKRILKSRDMRLAILRLLSFVPDKIMLEIQYFIKMGRRLNLKNPQRYTEKLQWYKLNYRNPEMVRCVDKYDVRSYVEESGLGDILNECYGIYDAADEIDFDKLPDKFVLKDTLGGGGNSVIVIKDKSAANFDEIGKRLKKWVNEPHHVRDGGREWPYYSGKKHRIIAERFIEPADEGADLVDYKFFCFNGRCEFIYAMGNRRVGEKVDVSIFDREFQKLPVSRIGAEAYAAAQKPGNFEQMRETAEKLASGFPHVRVDLYNVDSKILFGELTFFNASGYVIYNPDDFDFQMGEKFLLNNKSE